MPAQSTRKQAHHFWPLAAAALALALAARAADAPPHDTPQDYTHILPLTVPAASQGVMQLRLPADVYRFARTPELDDVRVFDAKGAVLPFALRMPAQEASTSVRSLPLRIFPVAAGGTEGDQPGLDLDLDVRTGADGRLLSVRVRPDQARRGKEAPQLSQLMLELPQNGKTAPLLDALRFTLPPERREYNAQVWLDTSDDLKTWDTVGAAELHWLTNQAAQTLASDRLEFSPRSFRYARLSWRSGTPLQFASISAEEVLHTDAQHKWEELTLQPSTGKQPRDLVYATPLAVPADRIGLELSESNIVLPVTLGSYRELPARQVGQPTVWRFEPLLSTTFYRITQNGRVRASGDLDVPLRHTTQWVLRPQDATSARPALRIRWEPATLVFLANGNAPYTLAVGRARAPSAARALAQVAPGFSAAELQSLQQASAGPAQLNSHTATESASAVLEAAGAAQRRLLGLWGVLLLGVGVLAYMVWRLIKQQQPQPKT